MSTRCQVIVRDSWGNLLWFYRYSDGYPSGVNPTIEKYLSLVKSGCIRDNVEQSSGWLIVLGAIEYQTLTNSAFPESGKPFYEQDSNKVESTLQEFEPDDWKVGAYEPSNPRCHGDIEYLYLIDLEKKEAYVVHPDSWEEVDGNNLILNSLLESLKKITLKEALDKEVNKE